MIPERRITRFPLLEKVSRLQSLVAVLLILFGFRAGAGIDFLQFADGKRSVGRIFSLIAVVKIYKLRFLMRLTQIFAIILTLF